ncbi:phage major capsid protein [Streptomyces sp. NPDC059037]|uniref:phage major capsid protein n=1 Tax=Streptomyces sp. NPDC059037 TaxID=3346710 RepID=UPI0036A68B3D
MSEPTTRYYPYSLSLSELHAERDRLAADGRRILERASGDLSDDDAASFQEVEARLDELKIMERQMRRILELAQRPGHSEQGSDPGPSGSPPGTAPLRDQALRVLDRAAHAPDHARHLVAGLLDRADGTELDHLARWTAATADPLYESAVGKLFRDPAHGHREFTAPEVAAFQRAKTVQRAMSLTDSAGGFMVPFTLDPSIILTNTGSANPLRRLARVVTTATDSWSGITSAGVIAHWDPEATETTDDSPTVAQPTITPYKGVAFVSASFEIAADSNIGEQLGEVITDAFDNLETQAFTLGTGSGQPRGIITAVSAVPGSVVTDAGTAYATGQPYAVQNALPPRWRPRAQWMANLSVVNGYRQVIKGTGMTESVIDDSGEMPRLLGWQLNENSAMDGTITGSAADYLLLAGDFRQFAIVDRIGTTIEYVPHLFGANRRPTGQRGWYAYKRTGSDVLVPDAFRLLNLSA